ncbi:alpha-glucosidase [Oribacterium sp. KHPX15]|uniref:glycoside hydrolase family 13 protein n=1 Tax=Oribacterium sp. KHPX15 TaxID=1855342 RepID=UPI00089C7456|nr:glycoside hydrolase family 13 protein [Oribacterium sp. KHPX15]SEA35481.1 alpha-glucosidase [Oribacterium sp. KHPX15]
MAMSKINWDALYTAGSEDYRSPAEQGPGDTVKIRFRTKHSDVDAVYIYFHEIDTEYKMHLIFSDEYFDYYEYQIVVGNITMSYSFFIQKEEEKLHYNRMGVCEDMNPQMAFHLMPGFKVPDWVKGAVMYQIFIDRFYDGDKSNNVVDNEYLYLGRAVKGIKNWETPVEPFDVHRFYGGDIQGVLEKLDYIQYLGVQVIYFNPLFVSPSNHKYDIQDYDHIDPHIGKIVRDGGSVIEDWETDNARATKYSVRTTNIENLRASDALFLKFVNACHERGMRVIIDGVFNHCGSYNKWMNKSNFYNYKDKSNDYRAGAYQLKDSPFHNYFAFDDNSDEAWPKNNTYEKWWGNDTLPKLNYEGSRELEEKILQVGRKWVSAPYKVDGWRLDVAADLGHTGDYNHLFWKKFRMVVKEANPDAVILAEHYGDPFWWLQGDEWDTIMNYDAFMEPITWFLTGMEKHSDSKEDRLRGDGKQFFAAMSYHMSRMPESSILCSMNQLSNHDHSRFMTRTKMEVGRIGTRGSAEADTGVNVALYRLAAMMQMTWPGAPTLYYGDEAGMTGWTEPDSRRPYPWGHEDFELIEYHHYLAGVHKRYQVFKYGALMKLMAGHNYVVYARVYKHEVVIVVIYCGEDEFTLQIPAWRTGIKDYNRIDRVLLTQEDRYNAGQLSRFAEDGMFECECSAYTGKIYYCNLSSRRK